MKTGNQADLRRYLETEHGMIISKQRISQLCKENNYRINKTKEGRIKIEKTAKSLLDSGFGKKSDQMRIAKEENIIENKKSQSKQKKENSKETKEEETDNGQPLSITDSRQLIEKRKAFQQAEKERINNEERLGKLIGVDEVGDRSFELWRKVRDSIQAIKDRCAIKIRSAATDHEAEQIIQDEVHNILTSIVAGYENIDDDALKKKLVLRLTK